MKQSSNSGSEWLAIQSLSRGKASHEIDSGRSIEIAESLIRSEAYEWHAGHALCCEGQRQIGLVPRETNRLFCRINYANICLVEFSNRGPNCRTVTTMLHMNDSHNPIILYFPLMSPAESPGIFTPDAENPERRRHYWQGRECSGFWAVIRLTSHRYGRARFCRKNSKPPTDDGLLGPLGM